MKIAYLAPEIPALSATFVYNEILQLEKLGHEIVPFSIHYPNALAEDAKLEELRIRVHYLYSSSRFAVFRAHLSLLVKSPRLYCKTILKLLSDIKTVGMFSRNAMGQVYRFFYAGILAQDLIKLKVELLHVHFAHVPADIAMYAGALSNIEFSITGHANDLFERAWLLKEKAERAAFFATISNFNIDFLSQKGVIRDKIKLIRCGVDLEHFSAKPVQAISEPVQLGVVGRLVEKKGIDNLIKAMAILKQRDVNANVSIAGSGPLEAELKLLATNLGLGEETLRFIGPLQHDEVANFVAKLDIFVLPCQKDKNGDMDGIPVVLMEAMLSGVPVISTRLSGIPELVVNGETGIIVEPADSVALADAVLRMSIDSQFRQTLVEKAVLKVKDEFSLVDNVSKLGSLFTASILRKS